MWTVSWASCRVQTMGTPVRGQRGGGHLGVFILPAPSWWGHSLLGTVSLLFSVFRLQAALSPNTQVWASSLPPPQTPKPHLLLCKLSFH